MHASRTPENNNKPKKSTNQKTKTYSFTWYIMSWDPLEIPSAIVPFCPLRSYADTSNKIHWRKWHFKLESILQSVLVLDDSVFSSFPFMCWGIPYSIFLFPFFPFPLVVLILLNKHILWRKERKKIHIFSVLKRITSLAKM